MEFKKKMHVFLIVILITTIYASFVYSKNQYINTLDYKGYIMKLDDDSESWAPNEEEIKEFEDNLKKNIKIQLDLLDDFVWTKDKDWNNIKEFIVNFLPWYTRQYWGTYEDGKKILVCQFHYGERDLSEGFLVVEGGGYFVFKIEYDINKKELKNLSINGPR